MHDRYSFAQNKVGFFFNESGDCRTEHGLSFSKNYIVFYNGDEMDRLVLEVGRDDISEMRLIQT